MPPITLIVRTEKGEFSAPLADPTREKVATAIEVLYGQRDEEIQSLRVEMPHDAEDEEAVFCSYVEDPGLSAEENAAWICDAVENFRY